jgi:hypothetical protein
LEPVLAEEFVFDLTVLGAGNGLVPLEVEGAQVPETGPVHHPARAGVDGHGLGEHPLRAEIGKGLADQRAGALGGVSAAPGGPAEAVAEIQFRGAAVLRGLQREPAEEIAAGQILRGPVSGFAQLVAPQDRWQHLALDHLARSRLAVGQVTHDLRITVEGDQVVRVRRCEAAQPETGGLQEYVH